MTQGSFVDKIIKEGGTPIHLVRCKDSGGRDCYFFLLCPMQKAQVLREAFARGPVTLTDYGQVVASGFGLDPSPEIKRMLKDKYDFDAEGM